MSKSNTKGLRVEIHRSIDHAAQGRSLRSLDLIERGLQERILQAMDWGWPALRQSFEADVLHLQVVRAQLLAEKAMEKARRQRATA